MAVYVDDLRYWPRRGAAGKGRLWCHMMADDLAELHDFARRLGLNRTYFRAGKFPHYDLQHGTRTQALAAGAQRKTARDLVRLSRQGPQKGLF